MDSRIKNTNFSTTIQASVVVNSQTDLLYGFKHIPVHAAFDLWSRTES